MRSETVTDQTLPPRVSRIQRLMTNLETGPVCAITAPSEAQQRQDEQTFTDARQLILDLLHMSEKPIGETIYAWAEKEAEKYAVSEGTIEDLATATRFAKRWLPEAFEANDQGQVAFGRAICDSVVSAAEAFLKKQNQNVEA
jgi:hypothetical protein